MNRNQLGSLPRCARPDEDVDERADGVTLAPLAPGRDINRGKQSIYWRPALDKHNEYTSPFALL